jgi:hypothetical protein
MFVPASSFVTSKIGMAYILVCLLVLLDYCFVYLLFILFVKFSTCFACCFGSFCLFYFWCSFFG